MGPARYSSAAGNGAFRWMRTLYGSIFSVVLHPAHIGRVEHLVGGIDHEIKGVDHVVGVEGLAVLKVDALAQVELERQIIDPAPRGGKRRLVFEGVRIAVDQLVPDHAAARIPSRLVLK